MRKTNNFSLYSIYTPLVPHTHTYIDTYTYTCIYTHIIVYIHVYVCVYVSVCFTEDFQANVTV